jgi:hydroxymethylpyrimidine/phosphomethylpyrimidine kinase
MMTRIALTIAGSDSSGGAGIQADLATFAARGVYGASVITAVTAQNTRGVSAVHAIPADIVAAQVDAVLSDLAVGAVKTGMVFSAAIIVAIADALERYPRRPLIVDPVMIATSGDRLIDASAAETLIKRLFPLSSCVTPNLAEAAALTQTPLAQTDAGIHAQALRILAMGASAVLIKGGHGSDADSVDHLVTRDGAHRFAGLRINTRNTHGTGCTLSAAIAAEMAKGHALPDAVDTAKRYLTRAIAAGAARNIGHGHGPVHHFHAFDTERCPQ